MTQDRRGIGRPVQEAGRSEGAGFLDGSKSIMHRPVGGGHGLTTQFDHRGRTIRGVDVYALSEQSGGEKSGAGAELGHADAPTKRREGGQGFGETLLRRGVRAIAVGSFVEAHGLRG